MTQKNKRILFWFSAAMVGIFFEIFLLFFKFLFFVFYVFGHSLGRERRVIVLYYVTSRLSSTYVNHTCMHLSGER